MTLFFSLCPSQEHGGLQLICPECFGSMDNVPNGDGLELEKGKFVDISHLVTYVNINLLHELLDTSLLKRYFCFSMLITTHFIVVVRYGYGYLQDLDFVQ